MRVAMFLYGWDATTAAEKVDTEQGRYKKEIAERCNPESA
jgi:hypothetical protein